MQPFAPRRVDLNLHELITQGHEARRINPFTAPACKISGLKRAHIHACKQYIWWSYNKSTFNTVHFNKNPSLCSCQKDLNDFKFDAFVGRFQSDGAASMAVKGLNCAVQPYASVHGNVWVYRHWRVPTWNYCGARASIIERSALSSKPQLF